MDANHPDAASLVAAPTLGTLISRAAGHGLRVDGLALADSLLDASTRMRLGHGLFSDASLAGAATRVRRIEFIADGVAPVELTAEPGIKSETVFRQEIDYDICKACRLCIEVCPKHVYSDDGFGRPDRALRRDEECTGLHQCGQCVDVCPENVIRVLSAQPVYDATLFVLLPAPPPSGAAAAGRAADFALPDPLADEAPLKLPAARGAVDWRARNRALDTAGFHPVLDTHGYARHFVDVENPEATIATWASEQGRDPALARRALVLLYEMLPRLKGLRQGNYRLGEMLHRIVDEVLHAGIEGGGRGARAVVARIVSEARVERPFPGAKTRPVGGLLPTGTSVAWKTPYGEEIPVYAHMEKCLGPECGLCVTHCPEGGGGEHSAIRMRIDVPRGTVPALVRGGQAFMVRIEDTDGAWEELTGREPFGFEVDPDFCKSCGICITCCPHDVIEPAPRAFDLRQGAA